MTPRLKPAHLLKKEQDEIQQALKTSQNLIFSSYQKITAAYSVLNRVKKIENNDHLPEKTKQSHINDYKKQANTLISQVINSLTRQLSLVANQYKQIKANHPGSSMSNQLVQLQAKYKGLSNLLHDAKQTSSILRMPRVVKADPVLAQLPRVPTQTPVMSRQTVDQFTKQARTTSWHSTSEAIKRYSKSTGFKEETVKANVIDNMYLLRFSNIFGTPAKDMSRTTQTQLEPVGNDTPTTFNRR